MITTTVLETKVLFDFAVSALVLTSYIIYCPFLSLNLSFKYASVFGICSHVTCTKVGGKHELGKYRWKNANGIYALFGAFSTQVQCFCDRLLFKPI